MSTPESTYLYYYYYQDSTYGVVSDKDGKVFVEKIDSGTHARVSKDWIKKKIEEGEIDISKDKEGFE